MAALSCGCKPRISDPRTPGYYYDGQLKNVQNLSDEKVVIFFLFWVDSATNLLSSANSTNLPTCCLCSGLFFFFILLLIKVHKLITLTCESYGITK